MNKAYELARKEIGTYEWKDGHNPKVVQYFADVGHAWVKDDETAWCAAFVGAMLKQAGLPYKKALNARAYKDYGTPVEFKDAIPGDILVYWREDPDSWKGHVGFYVRPSSGGIVTLGGNQSNQVREQAYPRFQLLAVRRPPEPPRAAFFTSFLNFLTSIFGSKK